LPLLAVALFSIKLRRISPVVILGHALDLLRGSKTMAGVFFDSDMPRYLLNSVLITVPTMIGAVALSALTGFCDSGHLPLPKDNC